MALDKLEPPLQVLRIPTFPHPSLAPWVNRELDMVAGKYLYSAQGQDKEVGVASATGTGGTVQGWPEGRGTGASADGSPEGISWFVPQCPLLTGQGKEAEFQQGGGSPAPALALGSGL